MNNITLDVTKLKKEKYDYLQELFEDFNGDSLDDFYFYLTNIKDVSIHISNIEAIDEDTTDIIRIINEVHNDYHNFELHYDLEESSGKTVIIDIDELNVRKHEYLKEQFDFPDYYGNNLDALYDCMSEMDETRIIIIHMDDVNEFSLNVIKLFDEVADEYGNLIIEYQDEEQ